MRLILQLLTWLPLLVTVCLLAAALLGVHRLRYAAILAGIGTILGWVLAFFLSGQITIFGTMIGLAAAILINHLSTNRRALCIRFLPALLLLVIGVLYQERIGPDVVAWGSDFVFAIVSLAAFGCYAYLALRPPNGKLLLRLPARALMLLGLVVLVAGTVGGILGGTQRSGIPLPVVGEVVIPEAARLPLIFGIALEISQRRLEFGYMQVRNVLAVAGFVGGTVLLGTLIAIQTGDTGGALILILTVMAVAAALTHRSWPVTVGLAGMAVLALPAYLLSLELRERIDVWLNPGYQQETAFIAFGRGGMRGRGFGYGEPYYVSRHDSDFVVAGLTNEFGIIGLVGLLGLLVCLLLALHSAAENALLPQGRTLAVTLCAILGVQALVNLIGVTGTGPVTGVPFPFLSRAGLYMLSLAPVLGYSLALPQRRPGVRSERVRSPRPAPVAAVGGPGVAP